MSHHVSSFFNKGMAFTANIDQHQVIMDTADIGGEDTGASPKKLMLAALGGCTGIDIVSILHKMKVPFSDFSIDTKASLTETIPSIYKDVKIIYTIRIAEKDRPKMEKAVKLSDEKYCGVSAMFKAFATVESTIIYL